MKGNDVAPSAPVAAGDQTTGVCHLTATARAGTDVEQLVVRLVMTRDVTSTATTTKHALGPEQACRELRRWMETVCQPCPVE
jgi:hypothetical protein